MLHERGVDVVAAEPRVAVGREHLEDARVQLEDGNVERAAAEIVDRDLRALAEPVQAVGERGGGRLVDDALDVKPASSPALLVAWRCASLKYAGTVMTARVTAWPERALRRRP